jgi:hypothetical protein
MTRHALSLVLALAATAALAGDVAPPATGAAADFERLKTLAGSWDADTDGDAKADTVVEYKLTASGTALVETLFPGTPHEMVTVYHLDGDALVLTHYCAAGNQPTMKAKPAAKDGSLVFEKVSVSNLTDPAALHMGGARITILARDKARTDWTHYEGGKAAGAVSFLMTRRQG